MNAYLEEKSLSELRDIADELGLEYPKNIGKAKLLEKIQEDELAVEGKPANIEGTKPKKKETVAELTKRMNILKRVIVSANDPQYKGRNGVSLKVGNSKVMVGKFIPFDTVWHIQDPIYKVLKNRKWRETKFKTDPATGNKYPVVTMRPAFVIEELEPLTKKELGTLATEQAARGSIPSGE